MNGNVTSYLLLVDLLHVLVVVLLLELLDENRLLVWVVRVLLLRVGTEMRIRLPIPYNYPQLGLDCVKNYIVFRQIQPVQRVLDLPPLVLLPLPLQLRQSGRGLVGRSLLLLSRGVLLLGLPPNSGGGSLLLSALRYVNERREEKESPKVTMMHLSLFDSNALVVRTRFSTSFLYFYVI